ncbi:hypothetical protein V428_07230 [Aeromonas hydrophila subsp. hydrophila AL09-71]|nr:hypothetical protein AHML_07005 [Aeromonas hydrophila ML09-119]AHX31879.1 hypothetical protein V428_07230 [Aeromonas hydrophila subsp. hydrophila AL09-71]AHX68677.1 hypothetical protein V429_07235 [Aeromonas hydrophila pc104A]KYQ11587.1 hypothetical protein AW872_02545 [Aeromonas hydrophila]KYQ14131.1 hypothetical protein AW873_02550 [Aeromonas hydrophila]
MNAGTLQVGQKAAQYTRLLGERNRSCLAAPETATSGVHADLIPRLAHAPPVLGIGEGEQLPLHPRPTQIQRDGAGVLTTKSEVQQPAFALASRLQFGLGGDQSQPLT